MYCRVFLSGSEFLGVWDIRVPRYNVSLSPLPLFVSSFGIRLVIYYYLCFTYFLFTLQVEQMIKYVTLVVGMPIILILGTIVLISFLFFLLLLII